MTPVSAFLIIADEASRCVEPLLRRYGDPEGVQRKGAVDHSDGESPHLLIAAISERNELF